jgi:Tol biopolymer transport system component
MRRIMFNRWVDKLDQIFEITRTSDSTWSAERQVTQRGGYDPRWSSDGNQLAYIAPGQIRLMGPGPDGEATSRVLYDFSDTTVTTPRAVAIRWNPRRPVLYMKTFDARANAAIWSLDVAGGPPRLLVRFDEPHRQTRRPEFATDGVRFYFTLAQSESDVWVIGVK